MATMSPASARSTGTRARPRKASSLVTRARLDHLAVAVERLDLAVDGDGAGFDAAGQNAAEIMVGLQRRHQHREGMLVARQRLRLGRRHVGDDALEQRRSRSLRSSSSSSTAQPCGPRHRDNGNSSWSSLASSARNRSKMLFQRFLGLGVGAVDLVDDHDGLQAQLQRLGEHELGLRHDAIRPRPPAAPRHPPWRGCAPPRRRNRHGRACRRC